jgi:lipoate-protein ligase B
MAFEPCLQLQLSAREEVVALRRPPTLIAVEHPPTLTLGRRGERADILWPEAHLRAQGVDVCESPRGGQVTLHAPGQLVVYPIVRIGWRIRAHITRLGEAAVDLLTELGVAAPEFRIDHPGVWQGPRKLASIGVHVSRGVTVQGIAINLAVDEGLFAALVSCGMPDVQMTNATAVGARAVGLEWAAQRYAELFARGAGETVQFAVGPLPPALAADAAPAAP